MMKVMDTLTAYYYDFYRTMKSDQRNASANAQVGTMFSFIDEIVR